MDYQKLIRLSAAGAAAMLITGCSYATQEELASVRAECQQVRKTADQANMTAREARDAAQQSITLSQNTEEIVNRSFSKTMRK